MGVCPHCGGPAPNQYERYPDALCFACADRAICVEHRRPLALGNESLSGGFVAWHRDDSSRCALASTDGLVLVDGARYRAGEAHMGGCVVRPIPG